MENDVKKYKTRFGDIWIDYLIIPNHMRKGMKRYVENGIAPGSFATAVLENKFVEAITIADIENFASLRNWAIFLYYELPSEAWGSEEKVEKWRAHRGLDGWGEKKKNGM